MLLKELVKAAQQERDPVEEEWGLAAPQAVTQGYAEQQDGTPGKVSGCGRRPSRSRRERWDRLH
jgi:hypothetical protein